MHLRTLALLSLACLAAARAERINHEGRILGPEPVVSAPTLFNTAAADSVLAALQIMPVDSAWNEDISRRPLLGNSAAMIAQIRADLASNRRTLRAFHEMNFVLVPEAQPLVPVRFVDYPDESDPSPYPLPANLPVETWPRETGSLSLAQWQQDVNNTGGDRHAIVVMPGSGQIWEMWQARLVGSQWQASNGAKFPLRANTLRPAGWTSADAAGLPMLPALVRYDECARGMVEHAMRVIVRRSRREYLYPATHFASSTAASEINVPAMGQRVRLKADFPIPASWTIFERAVLLGLKKYGALVADNGNFFSISVTPDDRYPAGAFDRLATIDVDNFEVVQSTGPSEGPRSPGAPTVDAGADLSVPPGSSATLNGRVGGTGLTTRWTQYSGPGTVVFANDTQPATSATFTVPGTYTLLLSARDGVHAPAFDATVVTVGESGGGGGTPPAGSSRLRNLSTRAATSSGTLITGFTIAGPGSQRVIVRAAGPALTAFGVTGVLADPLLSIFSGQTMLAQNDNWEPGLATDFAQVGAAAWTPGSRDAAVALSLPPGSYTAVVSGVGSAAGVALAEVFAVAGAETAKLVNLSTRSMVGAGGEAQIGGFVIDGSPKKVVVRASGPSLAAFGVTSPLADPLLTIYSGSTVVAQNDDWDASLSPDFTRVGAFSWEPGTRDAALVLTLNPGAYSAQVTGKNGATGNALIEVYEEN